MSSYRYTDKEIKEIMKGLVIISDSREQSNMHILSYFVSKKINYEIQKQDTGDYGCFVKCNPALGIMRDLYIPAKVERKAHWSELTSNLQKSTETRFINELIRSKDIPFTILIEDKDGYENLLNGKYNSSYKPQSLLGRMNTFKARYNFEIVYLDAKFSGNWIYHHLYYEAQNYIKNMPIQIYKEKEPTT